MPKKGGAPESAPFPHKPPLSRSEVSGIDLWGIIVTLDKIVRTIAAEVGGGEVASDALSFALSLDQRSLDHDTEQTLFESTEVEIGVHVFRIACISFGRYYIGDVTRADPWVARLVDIVRILAIAFCFVNGVHSALNKDAICLRGVDCDRDRVGGGVTHDHDIANIRFVQENQIDRASWS